jgi:hypothetical protein
MKESCGLSCFVDVTLAGLFIISNGCLASAQPTVQRGELERTSGRALFLQTFVADEDVGQCGFRETSSATPLGVWTPPVYINTDGRPGGCFQSFALIDPDSQLEGLSIEVTFSAYGAEKACDRTGTRLVQPSKSSAEIVWSLPYRIDTDDRPGGCREHFTVLGRADIVLDVEMFADGVIDQCPTRGRFTSSINNPVNIEIQADSRPGGCYQRFRLRINTGHGWQVLRR